MSAQQRLRPPCGGKAKRSSVAVPTTCRQLGAGESASSTLTTSSSG